MELADTPTPAASLLQWNLTVALLSVLEKFGLLLWQTQRIWLFDTDRDKRDAEAVGVSLLIIGVCLSL
jgi:hypothetical protein